MKTLSIVVPVYFNEPNLNDTVPRLLNLAKSLGDMALELVFVDDGSGDRSVDVLLEFQKSHPDKIRVVTLTRNFGSMAAVQAGLLHAKGDCVAVIAADLQDPAEMIVDMVANWRRGSKAVFAVRSGRKDPLLNRFFTKIYYALIRRYAVPDYPRGGFDFLLIDRQVVDLANGLREKNVNVMALIFWLGFKPVLLPYVRQERREGRSRWTFRKRFKFMLDSFVGFSYVPIRFLSTVGILLSTLAFVYGAFIFYDRLAHGATVQGWSALAVTVVFFGGLQSLMLGILGEYLWRTLDETRRRPSFVVDRVFHGSAR